MSLFPQRCKVCGKRDKMDFHVDDATWARVVPEAFQNTVVCLACFDGFASMRGESYSDALDREIYFVGDVASFKLRVVVREDPPPW